MEQQEMKQQEMKQQTEQRRRVDPDIHQEPPLDEMIERHDLRDELKELDEQGLVVIAPNKIDLAAGFLDRLQREILHVAEKRTGVEFDELGPTVEFEGIMNHQILMTHLVYEHPLFLELLCNPVKVTVMRYLLGDVHHLSTNNGWIKWRTGEEFPGEFTTGLHYDQGGSPSPWNPTMPLVANMNLLLTDYSRADGAFAYVPGSHLPGRPYTQAELAPRAVPVEAPRGSLVIFQGGTAHGAFRKQTPGLRMSMHSLHCRPCHVPQADFKDRVPRPFIERSPNPGYLRMLFREHDRHLEPNVGSGLVAIPKAKNAHS